jgi:FkbM family methyltransferase
VLCAASDLALVVCLLEGGDLELGTRLLIERFLEPGSVFVDVGANIGMHTMAAARAMRSEGRIFAFEPFGPVCGLLEKTVWMNGCAQTVEVHRSAVSNRKGRRDLFLGATSGHHSLFPLEPAGTPAHGQVSVETVTLDGTLPPDLKVDLLKIDAEGAELDVIEGARDLIDRHFDIALIVEFGPSHLKRVGHSASDWLGRFAAHGLIFRAIHPESGALEDRTPAALENEFSINLFFAREGSKAWGKLAK